MKRKFIHHLIVFMFPAILFAQGEYVPLNFSLWHPISFNHSTEDSVNVNFSGFYSNVKNINGICLSGGVSIIQKDLNGIQLNGGFTRVKRNFRGINITGAINAHGGNITGIDIAGLVNLGLADLNGIQVAGAYNFAFGNMRGAQAAFFFNVVGNDAKYFQFATANNVGGSFSGLQFAEVFNFTARTVRGVQFSLANIAGNLRGVQYGVGNVVLNTAKGLQFGLFNFAMEQRGVQIGILNSALKQKGMPFGLINLAKKNGDISWINFTSNFNALNTGLKFSANNFFSILGLGWYHWGSKTRSISGVNSFHYGYNFKLNDTFTLSPDLGFIGILQDLADEVTEDIDPATYKFSIALQARMVVEYKLHPKVRLISGIGFNRIYDIYKEQSIKRVKPILLAGISLF